MKKPILAIVVLVAVQSACRANEPADMTGADVETQKSYATADDPFEPLPRHSNVNARAAALGKDLYTDPILSDDGKVKCTDCHDLRGHGGGDGRKFPKLDGRPEGKLNAATVFNLAVNDRFGWLGKFKTMEQQLDGPLQGKLAMGSEWQNVLQRLTEHSAYRAKFEQLYDDGVTQANVRAALSEYQRSLITPNSKFDRFLRGEGHAGLSRLEARGYQLFKDLGCVSCHQGVGIGGNMRQRFGVMLDYPTDRDETPTDHGLYAVTRLEKHRAVFRVPSLRNVAVTAPYFHDGSVDRLEDAVKVMAEHQLGRHDLGDEAICLVTLFLRTLTGEFEGKRLVQDVLPGGVKEPAQVDCETILGTTEAP